MKHGGRHIRVHPCPLQLRNKHENVNNIKDDTKDNNLCTDLKAQKDVNQLYQNVNENEHLIIKNNIIENVNKLNNNIKNDINQLTNSISTLSLNEDEIESDDDIEINQNNSTKQNNYSNLTKTSVILPKVNTKVIC